MGNYGFGYQSVQGGASCGDRLYPCTVRLRVPYRIERKVQEKGKAEL